MLHFISKNVTRGQRRIYVQAFMDVPFGLIKSHIARDWSEKGILIELSQLASMGTLAGWSASVSGDGCCRIDLVMKDLETVCV